MFPPSGPHRHHRRRLAAAGLVVAGPDGGLPGVTRRKSKEASARPGLASHSIQLTIQVDIPPDEAGQTSRDLTTAITTNLRQTVAAPQERRHTSRGGGNIDVPSARVWNTSGLRDGRGAHPRNGEDTSGAARRALSLHPVPPGPRPVPSAVPGRGALRRLGKRAELPAAPAGPPGGNSSRDSHRPTAGSSPGTSQTGTCRSRPRRDMSDVPPVAGSKRSWKQAINCGRSCNSVRVLRSGPASRHCWGRARRSACQSTGWHRWRFPGRPCRSHHRCAA